ncbi:pirin family protein [Janthinobacterium sp.]|uniref:pirin family protein n=1 Tax=Janthinobacterium sp. TaxID=1871054 RepID=UPI00260B11DA|nr:pirin family protein [Janthinobacterium sp.]
MSLRFSNIVAARTMPVGTGCTIAQFRHETFHGAAMSPFVMVDHFHMWQPTFDVHPHAGFSAVTLMFEDSRGDMLSRDSLGHRSQFGAGDLHWTLAGSGILHTQLPVGEEAHIHALQIFVNLPARLKNLAPDSFCVPGKQMPIIGKAGVRVRIVAGQVGPLVSPARTPTPVLMLDIKLQSIAEPYQVDLPAGWNAWIHVVSGILDINAGIRLQAGQAICASSEQAGQFSLSTPEEVHCVLLAGPHIDEAVVTHGPFVFESKASLQQALERLQAGHFGTVPS